jgi:hypothetical protein
MDCLNIIFSGHASAYVESAGGIGSVDKCGGDRAIGNAIVSGWNNHDLGIGGREVMGRKYFPQHNFVGQIASSSGDIVD